MKKAIVIELVAVKSVVSVTFLAWWIHPTWAGPIAIIGNLIWLWLTPVLEDLKHREILKDLDDLKKEVDGLKEGH